MTVHSVVEAVREWTLRLLGSFRARSKDDDYRTELAHHLELAEQRFRDQGHSPAEAARLARLRYGHADNALEDVRRQQGIPWFGMFTLDVKLGLRMLRKFLGLTLIGGLALTVGFGLVIAVFVYFDVVVWSDSIPLDDGERVVAIQVWDPESSRRREISIADFERWRTELRSVDDIGAFRTVERDIVHDNGETEPVAVAEISAAGFRVARVTPLLGRPLLAEDERDGAEPVVVIGYDEWRSRFDGDADVLGRTLRLDDGVRTIVGVMPKDFGFPVNHQFWVPLQARSTEFVWAPPGGAVFARLAAGATLEEANAEISATGLRPGDGANERLEPLRPILLPYAMNFVDDQEPANLASRSRTARLVIFFISLLLIPPCVNIAMLVYARTVTRREEIAVRTALGASRFRIVLQLFIEMLVLSTVAAGLALVAVGVLLAFVEEIMLGSLGRMPFWLNFGLSLDIVLFAAALAVLAALIIGFLPALGATRSYVRPGLSALDPRNQMRLGPVWTLLIVAQVAFSFAALPSAVELGWGVLRSHVLGPGFAAEQYLTARLVLDADDTLRRSEPDLTARYNSAKEALIRRIEADPRIQSRVAMASAVPGEGQWMRYRVEDEAADGVLRVGPLAIGVPLVRSIGIDDRYLEVFDFDLLVGRSFEPGEHQSGARSVLVNATFAQEAFPDTNPLGRRITFSAAPGAQDWFEVVGVVADRPAHPYGGSVFYPVDRSMLSPASIGFRTELADGRLREELRTLAALVDPALELEDIVTLKELYGQQAVGNYIGGFALIAVSLSVLALAAAGTYALMSFTVNQRRREIAIRMSLGARPHKLLRGIFRRALVQVSFGAALGAAFALLVQRTVPPTALGGLDVPGVLPGAIALLVLIGLAASFEPARRALRTDPIECLHDTG